jgi:quinoprotein relay system zinc metallohydrolase 2
VFEAVITACLIAVPDVCRDQLLPGYEAAEADTCAAELSAHSPVETEDPRFFWRGIPTCRSAGSALHVEEIAPGVFVHLGEIAEPDPENLGDVANLGFIVGSTHVAVIDTGSTRSMGEALWRAIRQQTELPVSHVIVTHMHPDHALGAAAFSGTGALFIGHAALPRALADRQANYIDSLERLIGLQPMIGTQSVPIDVTVPQTLNIDLGGRSLQVEAWPRAHTGTDVTVLDDATQTLFTGDLVFDRHTPALDGSLPGWRAVLERLEQRELQRIVPGHGGPVLDWPGGADATARYLNVLETDTRAAIDAGQRLGDAVETIATSEAGAWELFEAYNSRNATVAFTELEWN